MNVTDFLYTCDRHLNDRGFATRLDQPKEEVPAVSKEEIERVKRDWEAKQKEKEKEDKDKDKDKGKEKEKAGDTSQTKVEMPAKAAADVPTHTRFALHRDVFAMRVDEQRRARERKAAKELAPRLPGAPVGGL